MHFNNRVLLEAADESIPLYERLKFLAIFSSNLDEFFRVRVSRLRQLKKIKKEHRKKLAVRPNKSLKEVLKLVDEQQQLFGDIYKKLLKELQQQGVYLVKPAELDRAQQEFCDLFYKEEVLPILRWKKAKTDMVSFLRDGFQYIFLSFKESNALGFVELPTQELSRFIELPSDHGLRLIYLEDIIKMNLEALFRGKEIAKVYQIKLSRDAELYLEDTLAPDIVTQIRASLSKRNTGQPTRLLFDYRMPKELQKTLRKSLGLSKIDMIPGGKRHNFSDFFALPFPNTVKQLKYQELPPLMHLELEKFESMFTAIKAKDQVLHFPFQSFDYVSKLVEQAAVDPAVTRIQISLYRTAKASRLTSALLKAVDQGKDVRVFIEAQARFDEQNNINWGKTFKEKGAQVFYSIKDIKVHSKIMLISRLEANQETRYGYIGTGNFNEKTSKIYCDHALLTAHPGITLDLEQVFKVIQREIDRPKLNHLLVSPFNARSNFEALIKQEITNAKAGLPANITAKMNSLEDKKMISLLYEASKAGVPVRLIVRGFCRLMPEIESLSDQIYVTSIVDRYLEHGRLFKFYNNGDPLLFTGSADWMTRNLDRRVEVITPLLDREVFNQLDAILTLQSADNQKARVQDAHGKNPKVEVHNSYQPVRSQYAIYQYLGGNINE